MSLFLVSFLASLVATFGVLRTASFHGGLSADHDFSGPQKFHTFAVPRVGGFGVASAIVIGAFFAQFARPQSETDFWALIVCGVPAFSAGILEDLTKKVSPRVRLIATAMSASLAAWLLGAVLDRTDIPGVDFLMVATPFAIALTLLCVTGVANAINIIDGFNGLASMCVMMMMLGVAYVAFQVGDDFAANVSLVCAGAVLGFFVWNFPAGLIFLGDGGAYFLGFLLAELSVLLVHRNDQVSPIFPLLLCAYPIFETVFTMYRRKVLRGVPTGAPDGIHLHTLIHRRLIRINLGDANERRQTTRNSMTSPFLWVLCLFSIIPSVLWWNSTPMLATFLLLFIALYVFLYWRIVRFRTPRWLRIRR